MKKSTKRFLLFSTAAFAGMYETSAVIAAIKGILNVGVVIVLLQSISWANGEQMLMRRGEFYELLLVTLFGMYLMISARHFLLFIVELFVAELDVEVADDGVLAHTPFRDVELQLLRLFRKADHPDLMPLLSLGKIHL